MVQLHAHCSQNGSHRASRASLFANHLAHIARRNPQPQNCVLVPVYRLHFHGFWLIYKGPRNLTDQLIHSYHIYLGHALAPDRTARPQDPYPRPPASTRWTSNFENTL